MDTKPAVVLSQNATATHALGRVVELTRQGDIDGARTLLGIPKEVVDDAAFVTGISAFDSAMRLVNEARQQEAVPLFQQATAIIQHSTDADSKFLVELLSNNAEGVARLIAGDAVGAHRLLDHGADALKRLSFFDPSLERMVLYYKGASLLAFAQSFLPVGDLEQMTRWLGKADDVYNQLLARLDLSAEAEQAVAVEIFCTRLEAAVSFARFDFEALDFESVQRRLAAARPWFDSVHQLLPKIRQPVLAPILQLSCTLYVALWELQSIAADSIAARKPLSKPQILQLQKIRTAMFTAKSSAEAAGDRGARYLYTIRQLSRVTDNLLRMGSVTNRDFGRLAGLVSLGALVVLTVLVHLTFHPDGWMAFGFFFGNVVVALIVGFGYGALRFQPLLKLVGEVLQNNRESASDTEAGGEATK